jgi:putative PIN family toxin of toxin-antitoxin system
MIKVVFDTNVWVSGLVFKGEVRKALQKVLDEEARPVISIALLRELEKVLLSAKIGYSQRAAAETLHQVQELCLLVHPTQTIHVIRADPADNKVLECALEGIADLIVSGDKHLLDMKMFRGIRIITPKEFLDI